MKLPKNDSNIYSVFTLIITSAILAVSVLLTDRRDLTSAAVVLSAMVLFLAGVYIFTFSKKESVDGRISALLPTQGSINLCRIAADLGVSGHSWFVPSDYNTDNSCMQYLPVSVYNGERLSGGTFISDSGGAGILLQSSGEVIMSELKSSYKLTIPDTDEELAVCIREIGEELLEIADKILVSVSDEAFTVTMKNYRLADGCYKMGKESPACCMIYPCPICSLFAMVLAEGRKLPVQVERCRTLKRKSDVEVIYSFFSSESTATV
jgi:hypothetical protein